MNYQIPIAVVIPAAAGGVAGVFNQPTHGRIFTCLSASAAFKIRADSGSLFDLSVGRSFGKETSPEFGRLGFYNESAVPIVVTGIVTNEPYKTDTVVSASVSVSNKPAPTYTKATTQALGAGASVDFNGLDGANVRKTISIFNASSVAGDVLQVRDQASVVGHEVDPRQSFAKESSGFYKVHNATAGAITVRVMEEFLL